MGTMQLFILFVMKRRFARGSPVFSADLNGTERRIIPMIGADRVNQSCSKPPPPAGRDFLNLSPPFIVAKIRTGFTAMKEREGRFILCVNVG